MSFSYFVEKEALLSNPAANLKRPRISKHHLRDSKTATATSTVGTVSGTVLSGGKPVNLAKVQTARPGGQNPHAYTDTSGYCVINNVPSGTIRMTVTQGTTTLYTKSVTVSRASTVNFP